MGKKLIIQNGNFIEEALGDKGITANDIKNAEVINGVKFNLTNSAFNIQPDEGYYLVAVPTNESLSTENVPYSASGTYTGQILSFSRQFKPIHVIGAKSCYFYVDPTWVSSHSGSVNVGLADINGGNLFSQKITSYSGYGYWFDLTSYQNPAYLLIQIGGTSTDTETMSSLGVKVGVYF